MQLQTAILSQALLSLLMQQCSALQQRSSVQLHSARTP